MRLPQDTNTLIDIRDKSVSTEISWGVVQSVDPKEQTMVVESGAWSKKETVKINNAFSKNGAGIKFMPVPGQTNALIYNKDGMLFHLGYFFENAGQFTEDKLSKKESAFLLHRYLEPGEVQLYSIGQNEIFLSKDGNVYIKSGSSQFIKLDDTNSMLEGVFGSLKFEMDEVRVRAGNIRRPINEITNEDEYVTEEVNNETVYLKEFSVSVGNLLGDDIKDVQSQDENEVDQYPYDGFLSLASKVFNEQGTAEKVLDSFLKFLLRFPTGISISVNEEGDLVFLDQSSQNYIKFKPGYDKENEKHLTEFEIKLNKSVTKINDDGELTYSNEDSEDANKKTVFELKKTPIVTIKNTDDGSNYNTITLDTSGIKIEDKNEGNKVEQTSSGTTVEDKNGNKIEMTSSGLKITTATGEVTGGQLTVNGSVAPNGSGPFCGLPNCLFTGAPQTGNIVSGT